MNPDEELVRRFIVLPLEKRRTLWQALQRRQVEIGLLPIPAGLARTEQCELSLAQARMHFLWRLDPSSGAYHIAAAARLRGRLDEAALQRSLDVLVARHGSLRTSFPEREDGRIVQRVREPAAVPLEKCTFAARSEAELALIVRDEAAAEALRPFDLEGGSPLRVKLLSLGTEDHVVLVTLHHIAGDEWSLGLMVEELGRLYAGYAAGREPKLEPLGVQYADYALWQRSWLEAGEGEKQLEYWKEKLGKEHPVLELPSDRPRPAVQEPAGAHERVELGRELSKRLGALSRERGATLFQLLLAAFDVWLYRHTGQRDIRVGTPVANRNRVETEGVVGLFVNTLVLRSELDGRESFEELLERVKECALGAQSHQDVPFEQVVEALEPKRSLSHHPLFQVMYNHLKRDGRRKQALRELGLEVVERAGATTQFDLMLTTTEDEEGVLTCDFGYATALFERATVKRLVERWLTLLGSIAAQPKQAIGELSLISQEETRQLQQWNATGSEYPASRCLPELIEERVSRSPEATSVRFEQEALSYGELDARANRLARALRARGVGPDVLVGVAMERSLELVVALLGVLKAGGAYVPLDPEYPRERLAYMLQDAQPRVLLTQEHLLGSLPSRAGTDVWCLERGQYASAAEGSGARLESLTQPEHLAYCIYTSGSTGRPKGACNTHRGLVNRLHWMQSEYQLTSADRVLQKTVFSFDVSVWEFFWPLLTGAELIMAAPGAHRDPVELGRVIRQERVTTLHFVPSMLQAFVASGELASCTSVRQVMCSGEALPLELQRQFLEQHPAALHNLYGPTEASIDVTYWQCRTEAGRTSVPIGQAIANTTLQILDAELNAVPVGVTGELYLGGVGLGRGYLGRPGLTAERFVPSASETGERLYRTGDLARWRDDGAVEYMGRVDHQVKLRGLRIELGEIESRLREHLEVHDAVVVAAEGPTGKRLVGYVVPERARTPAAERELSEALKQHLAAGLPEYMVPGQLVLLSELPLSPNGKLDRKALPAPGLEQREYLAPATESERQLALIWQEVLRLEQVGRDDDFFELGGHSLLATQVASRIKHSLGVQLPLRALFEATQLGRLAARVEQARAAAARDPNLSEEPALVAGARPATLPLAPAQTRLWISWKLAPDSAVYNLAAALRRRGALDQPALQSSFDALVLRHEALRTRFATDEDGTVTQVVDAASRTPIVAEQLAEFAVLEREARMLELARAEALRAFDLEGGSPLRVKLLSLGTEDHVVLVTLHHIAGDEWSLGLMVAELGRLYAGYAAGREPKLEPLGVQYADYALWQRSWLEAGEGEKQLEYWKEKLGKEHPVLELPSDRPRPAAQEPAGAHERVELGRELSKQLGALSRERGATLFQLLLAAFDVWLYRHTGQRDIRVGTPVANRNRVETEGVVGLFVNTLVLRSELDGRESFEELLERVKECALGAQSHQDVPFEQVVEALEPKRSLSHHPLFQVMYNHLKRDGRRKQALRELGLEVVERAGATTQFDLMLTTTEDEEGVLTCDFGYATALFERGTVERFARRWVCLLSSIANDPKRAVAELELSSAAESRQIAQWNATGGEYPASRCLPELIDERVSQSPEATAVRFEQEALSYGELDARANRLARALRARGVGPDVLVGVAMERSLELVVALLGVLKAGGAYVPLDPEYPRERLAYMLEDAQPRVLLTQEHLLGSLPSRVGTEVWCVQHGQYASDAEGSGEKLERLTQPEHLAYCIYTSGSTGRPKGACNTHRGLVNRLHWMQSEYELTSADRVLQKTVFSFDVSVWEFFWPLLTGAELIMSPPGAHRDPVELGRVIRQERVTTLHFVPSMLQAFVASGELASCTSVRQVMCSGEALPLELQRQFLEQHPAALHNLYGPTEASIDVTYWQCRSEAGRTSVPIGRAIANTTLQILDAELNAVPVGVTGELYLGGVGLGRGYLGRPGLTAERFVPSASETGERMYRTGDLARWRDDGAVEYMGRVDHQVKLRGLRIELGEIESRLREHVEVHDAVVVAAEGPTGKRLVGYVVPERARTPAAERELSEALKQHLAAGLPEYMVPGQLVLLSELPLSPNGKLDRKALPAPEATLARRPYVAPRDERERQLTTLWSQILRLDSVGIHDNFFELGGDSIVALQLVAKAKAAGLAISPKHLFQYQTVAQLAPRVTRAARAVEQAPATGRVELTPIQRWFFERELPERSHFNQSVLLTPRVPLNAGLLGRAVRALVEHHDAFRLRFASSHTGSSWEQRYAASEELTGDAALGDLVWVRSLPDAAALTELAEAAQRSLDLGRGPLCRVALFSLPTGEQRLLVVIHHLIVDGVSWRILLEDLQMAYAQLQSGQSLQLPEKTASFQSWSAALQRHAESAALRAELPHWQTTLSVAPVAALPEKGASQLPALGELRVASSKLPRTDTTRLLHEANQAYTTQTQELLLTALARVLCRWSGAPSVLVYLEGHGREDLFEGLDVSRTVGWFTSLFPVRLTPAGSLADSIEAVRRQLRSVPSKGLGYGIARYLATGSEPELLAGSPVPEVLFNYLGQFDGSFDSAALLVPARESRGREVDARGRALAALSVDAQVYDGELGVSWSYGKDMYREQPLLELAQDFQRELSAILAHCAQRQAAALSSAEVVGLDLSRAALDDLLSEIL